MDFLDLFFCFSFFLGVCFLFYLSEEEDEEEDEEEEDEEEEDEDLELLEEEDEEADLFFYLWDLSFWFLRRECVGRTTLFYSILIFFTTAVSWIFFMRDWFIGRWPIDLLEELEDELLDFEDIQKNYKKKILYLI